MSSATCHLSGLPIGEDTSVLAIPVSYTHLRESSTMCYGTNYGCHPFWIAMTGIMAEYGQVGDISNSNDIDLLLTIVNKGLLNNKRFHTEEKKSFMDTFFGTNYALIERKEYTNDFECLEYLSDHDIDMLIRNKERLHKIQEIETGSQLLSILSSNYLCAKENLGIERYGLITIKLSVFERVVKNNYSELKKEIESNIWAFLKQDKFDSHTEFARSVLKLKNNNDAFDYEIFEILTNMIIDKTLLKDDLSKEKLAEITSFVDGIVNLSLVSHIYLDASKSFYPNVRNCRGMKAIFNLNNSINEEINDVRKNNRDKWSVENGYSESEADEQEWVDY
jgi:hypothetical protein